MMCEKEITPAYLLRAFIWLFCAITAAATLSLAIIAILASLIIRVLPAPIPD